MMLMLRSATNWISGSDASNVTSDGVIFRISVLSSAASPLLLSNC